MAEVDERIRGYLADQNAAKAAEAAGEPLPALDDLVLDDEPITLSD